MEKICSLWEQRIAYWELDANCVKVMITNAIEKSSDFYGGPSGKTMTIEQLHPEGLEKLKIRLANTKNTRNGSRLKQKFYTYAYNDDIENLIKTHEKLKEWEANKMEEMAKSIEEGEAVNVFIDESINHGSDYEGFGEGGYKEYCDYVKGAYEQRKMIIEYVKTHA